VSDKARTLPEHFIVDHQAGRPVRMPIASMNEVQVVWSITNHRHEARRVAEELAQRLDSAETLADTEAATTAARLGKGVQGQCRGRR
jgi:hypothetical protein